MQNATFPINYFYSILSPVRAFLGRKQLTWPKILFVLLFLNGLMMIPITLNYTQSVEFSLEPTFPTVFDMVDEEVLTSVQQAEVENGTVTFPESFQLEKGQGVVAGGMSEAEEQSLLTEEYVLLFSENRMILKEADLPISEIPYTADFSFSDAATPEELKETISMQWYYANQTYIVATYSFMITAILMVMNLFLVFGAAFFIFLAARSGYMEIAGYRQSVNLILNAMGLPVILSMLVGLWLPDITMMMSIQTFGVVIMIVLIYFKTRFQEGFVERQRRRDAGLPVGNEEPEDKL